LADDAGALLVRSGLVTANALDEARARVQELGGTLGEALVVAGAINDDALTEFFCTRLLVPKVNPNSLAKLLPKVIAVIPADMAIELRSIPVSLDSDNNLTVAMSDPSDRHAVDEIAFFTGAYVVRAVATQMQIAWCLAHYYGHVTPLGQRLLQPSQQPITANPLKDELVRAAIAPASQSGRMPRAKGLTGKVDAARHRALPPMTGPVVVQRPNSKVLDEPAPVVAGTGAAVAASVTQAPTLPPIAKQAIVLTAQLPATQPAPVEVQRTKTSPYPAMMPAATPVPTASLPEEDDAIPKPRAKSISGEIHVPKPRAQSIRPPLPEEDESGPIITMEVEDSVIDEFGDTPPPPKPVRKQRIVKEDPPELYARAGEVESRPSSGTAKQRPISVEQDDEPSIMVDTASLQPPPPPELEDKTGEIDSKATRTHTPPGMRIPEATIEIAADPDAPEAPDDDTDDDADDSQPILLDRKRTHEPLAQLSFEDDDTDDTSEIVVLATPKPRAATSPVRTEKRTQIGIVPNAAVTRAHRDTAADGIPGGEYDDRPTEASIMPRGFPPEPPFMAVVPEDDATRLDAAAAPADPTRESTDETLAAPPRPGSEDTNPNLLAVPPAPITDASDRTRRFVSAPSRIVTQPIQPDASGDDDDEDDRDEEITADHGPIEGSPITAPTAPVTPPPVPATVETKPTRRIDFDPVDDGWGPPGTTIPPPLLGAVPGTEDAPGGRIPVTDVDSAPLIVTPPSPPEPARGSPGAVSASGQTLVRALEDATSRAIELLRQLEAATDRDHVIKLLIAHLAATHQRAGFFAVKGGELSVFQMVPRPPVMPSATLRLDRPSTLQDVVGTRLPYRGPMHDDASRMFLASVLGATPAEILLVPLTIRERVVGVLFGEHRLVHTFDDQLALAARAAGMSLERILRLKRT